MLIRILIAICLAAFSPPLLAKVSINQSAYSVKLDGDWTQAPCAVEDQVGLISRSLNAQARIQYIACVNSKPETLEREARLVVKFGIKQELGNSHGRPFVILGQSVRQMPGGYVSEYYGRDETKRSFRYVGLILPDKILNIYVEMPTAFEANLESITKSIVKQVHY